MIVPIILGVAFLVGMVIFLVNMNKKSKKPTHTTTGGGGGGSIKPVVERHIDDRLEEREIHISEEKEIEIKEL